MMTRDKVRDYLKAQPFRTFRLHLPSGRTFDVRHPEFVALGRAELVHYSSVSEDSNKPDEWHTISLMLIEFISHVEVAGA